jgi:hypothetical protein
LVIYAIIKDKERISKQKHQNMPIILGEGNHNRDWFDKSEGKDIKLYYSTAFLLCKRAFKKIWKVDTVR